VPKRSIFGPSTTKLTPPNPFTDQKRLWQKRDLAKSRQKTAFFGFQAVFTPKTGVCPCKPRFGVKNELETAKRPKIGKNCKISISVSKIQKPPPIFVKNLNKQVQKEGGVSVFFASKK
jgi:hypothetical protein